jgi:hypothetical protein
MKHTRWGLLARHYRRTRRTEEELLILGAERAAMRGLVSLAQIQKAGGRTYRP